MIIWASLSLLSSLAFLYLGIFVFCKNPKELINRMLLAYCIVCSYAGFTEFMCRQSESANNAYLWIKIGAFWPFLLPLQLHFAILFTEKTKWLQKKLIYSLLYMPALFLSIVFLMPPLIVSGAVKEFWGYAPEITPNSWASWSLMGWSTVLSFFTLFLYLNRYLVLSDKKEKQQAGYLFIGFSITVFAAFLTQVLPIVFETRIPGLAAIAAISIPISFVFGIRKVDLFALTPRSAADGIMSTMSDCLLLVDPDKKIKVVNRATLELLGYNENKIIGQPVHMLFEEGNKRIFEQTSLEKTTKTDSVCHVETSFKSKEGQSIPVSLSVSLVHNEHGIFQGTIYVARDIREQRRMEKEVVEIESREQLRIGHDLHDGLGQHLTGIAFRCKALEEKLKEGSRVETEDMAKTTELVNQATDYVRQLSRGLSPVEMQADGLMTALQELTASIKRMFGIPCIFKYDKPVTIQNEIISTHLYRIAQEAVTNALKHAKPKYILISLDHVNSRIFLTITDDGVGIQQVQNWNKGMGLRIMNYRARLIGASLNIQRGTKQGTVVSCSVMDDSKGKEPCQTK